jgi:hypothetical protein
MATQFDFSNIGSMFGGGMGGTPTGLDALLSEDQRKLMGRNATLAAAAALLQAGGRSTTPIGLGQALGSALQAGQQGYQQARAGSVQDLLLNQKLEEAKTDRERQAQMSKLFPQVFQRTTTPETAEMPGFPGFAARDDEGNLMPGAQVTPASTQLRIDPNKLQALAMLSKNPLESLGQIAKLVPDLRRAGFTGAGTQTDNPFTVFTADQTIPANIRNVAKQYESSFASGVLDPEKADDRVRQLAEMTQRAQQFTLSQDEREANRLRMEAQFKQSQDALEQFRTQGQLASKQARDLQASIAQQSLDLRKQAEANKPEQFSYSQKKEFDEIQKSLAEAKSAGDSASLAARAAPLISQAYGGKIESGIKGLAGAVGFTTDAKTANDQLVQISQQLALKTPKFSGPTSDADAKRYDKAVGDLANPSVSQEAKIKALTEIGTLAKRQKDFAQQQENFYFANNKSLRGFTFTESNPFGK